MRDSFIGWAMLAIGWAMLVMLAITNCEVSSTAMGISAVWSAGELVLMNILSTVCPGIVFIGVYISE